MLLRLPGPPTANYDILTDQDNVLNDDGADNDSNMSFIPSHDDEDIDDDLSGFNTEQDADNDNNISDDDDTPYFTPKTVIDDNIPFSPNTFPPMTNFNPLSSFVMELQLMHLFQCNKGSLKMFDEMISIIQHYINSMGIRGGGKLLPRQAFISQIEDVFNTEQLKPKYGSVYDLAMVPLHRFLYLIQRK